MKNENKLTYTDVETILLSLMGRTKWTDVY